MKCGHKITTKEEHHVHHSPCHAFFHKLQQNSKMTITIYEIKYDR